MSALGCKVNRNEGAHQFGLSGWQTVTFQRTVWEEGATFWASGTPTRVTIPTTGLWFVTLGSRTQLGDAHYARVVVDGTSVVHESDWAVGTTGNPKTGGPNGFFLKHLTAGQYLELQCNTSAGSFNITSFEDSSPVLACHYYGNGLSEAVGAKAARATDFTPITNAWVSIPFTTEAWDSDGFIDIGAQATRITIPVGQGGKYLVGATYSLKYVASWSWNGRILANGTREVAVHSSVGTDRDYETNMFTIEDFSAGDYIELQGYNNLVDGTSLAGEIATELWVKKIDTAS